MGSRGRVPLRVSKGRSPLAAGGTRALWPPDTELAGRLPGSGLGVAGGRGGLLVAEPPFYFQNLASPMYPKHGGPDGTPTWSQPMRSDSRTIHMGDITELGYLVVGAFEQPEQAGAGQHLSLAGDLLSWDDIVAVLRRHGHNIAFEEMSAEDWDSQNPWGASVREMFSYFDASSVTVS